MFDIIFPAKTTQKYWSIHYQYVLNIFKHLNCNITYEVRDGFVVTINGQPFLFDYNDHHSVADTSLRVFKFHCRQPTSRQVIPFPPVSFYDWDYFRTLQKEIDYKGYTKLISCRQRAYGNAKIRRMVVQELLRNEFHDQLLDDVIPSHRYWEEINFIWMAVFVPGFCNNMLDRGSFEYLALGCPLITTRIPEYLPFDEQFKPRIHYIECRDDYGDLIDLVKMYRDNIHWDQLKEMGKRAKLLFDETSTPERIGKWIAINL